MKSLQPENRKLNARETIEKFSFSQPSDDLNSTESPMGPPPLHNSSSSFRFLKFPKKISKTLRSTDKNAPKLICTSDYSSTSIETTTPDTGWEDLLGNRCYCPLTARSVRLFTRFWCFCFLTFSRFLLFVVIELIFHSVLVYVEQPRIQSSSHRCIISTINHFIDTI